MTNEIAFTKLKVMSILQHRSICPTHNKYKAAVALFPWPRSPVCVHNNTQLAKNGGWFSAPVYYYECKRKVKKGEGGTGNEARGELGMRLRGKLGMRLGGLGMRLRLQCSKKLKACVTSD